MLLILQASRGIILASMWGSFWVSIDLPKPEDSDPTMEARLKSDPEMEVTPKLLVIEVSNF